MSESTNTAQSVAAHLTTSLFMAPNHTVVFDDLVAELRGKLAAESSSAAIFGTSIDRAAAWMLAPLLDIGEAVWDSATRRVSISSLGIQLLAAEAGYAVPEPPRSPASSKSGQENTQRSPGYQQVAAFSHG
jgi:hypothetical protein